MILAIQLVYVIGLSLWLITQGIFPSLELIFILLTTTFAWRARFRSFLADFVPFLLLLLGYEALRGFAYQLAHARIHVLDLIAWEQMLFNGIIPASYLQHNLLNQPYTPLLNIITNMLYMSHFLVPLVAAVALWYHDRSAYWHFMFGLVLLSYAGFVTFVLFPAAPPWWATQHGYLPEGAVELTQFVLPSLALFISPNPVAAMPSLHAAYPAYIALYCILVWGRKAWLMLLLPLGVAFSAVYLGHHYVIDILAGFLYAAVAFGVVVFWQRRKGYGSKLDVSRMRNSRK
jgi:membrane-associated phospholipid phosphatase